MLCEACQDSWQWICYRLADSASSGELPATRAAAVPQRWREARLPNAEFVFTARGAVCRYDAPSQMRQGTLRHEHSHHSRVHLDPVYPDVRVRLIDQRFMVVVAPIGMNVNAFVFTNRTGPEESWVRSPDLNPPRILRLLDVQCSACGFGPTDLEPTRGSDDLNWIAYADLVISEEFAAACA